MFVFHKIKKIRCLPFFTVWAKFEDGRQVAYNMASLFDRFEIFKTFQTIPGLFETARISAGGYGIEWNDDIDIAAEEIYVNGTPLELEPEKPPRGEVCPTCRQMIRRSSEMQKKASIMNLSKRKHKAGRKVNPNSKRQQAIRAKVTAAAR